MFIFADKFDTLENDELILKITQKYSGDDEMIPFYYYDIIRKRRCKKTATKKPRFLKSRNLGFSYAFSK